MRFWAAVIALLISCAVAWAAVPSGDASAEISAVLYAASATQVASQKVADARLRSDAIRIAELQKKVTAGAATVAELTAAQTQYVDRLAKLDRAYAAEIAVFRNAVTKIAATPEGIRALAKYNAGDHLGALAILDSLRAANDAARNARNTILNAAEAHKDAELTLDALKKGDPAFTTLLVIARYEEVTRLDPGLLSDWLILSRLYVDAQRLTDAQRASEIATKLARDDGEAMASLNSLGDVLVLSGDLTGARKAFGAVHVIARRLVTAAPDNGAARHELWNALWKLAAIPGSGIRWSDVVAQMESANAMGALSSEDQDRLKQAKQYALPEIAR